MQGLRRSAGTRQASGTLLGAALLVGLLTLAVPASAQITFRNAASTGNPETISFIAAGTQVTSTTSGGSLTPAIPGAAQAGDLALVFVAGRPTNNTDPGTPSGWNQRANTSLREMGATDLKIIVFWKVLAGGDTNPSFTVPSQWAAGGISAAIGVWRGVDTTTPFDVANDVTGNTGAADQWAAPAITTVTANAWVVSAVATSDNNALAIVTANSFTGRLIGSNYDTNVGGVGGHSLGVADKVQATAGAVTMLTWDQTVNGTDQWAGITLALRPATGALTISKPTGTVQNDVMIASIAVRPNTVTLTPPSGWNLVRRVDNSNATASSLAVYYKVAGASEAGFYTWTVSTHTGAAGGIQTFVGVDTSNPIDVENGQNTPNGTAHATPIVTTTVYDAMLVTSHGVANPDTWTPPTGMTEAVDVLGANQALESNYVLQGAIGATGAKQATSATADVGNAHILALRPLNACTMLADATYVAASAQSGTQNVTVYWSSAYSPLILRKTSAFASETPTNGTSYAAGSAIGAATVVYDGSSSTASMTCTAATCTDGSLTDNTTYYYKLFPRRGNCYAPGTGTEVNATPKSGTHPAWSYTLAGGPLLKPGIAGEGTVHTASNAARIVSINTADGTQTWAPYATNDVIQGWVSWMPTTSSAAWYNASWTARKRIRIDATKVGAGGVTNFPVLISLTDTAVKSKALASGNDILFTSSNGTTKLSHEIERYTSATGELIAWVKVPSVSSATDTDLYMYYGNAAAANQQDPANVWDASYRGVWHLKEDPGPGGAGDIKDSTSYVKHGTAVALMTSADLVPGKIGGGLNFASGGSGTYVSVGDHPEFQLSTYSWSMWIKGNVDPVCLLAGGTNGQPLWNADSQFNFAWQHTGCTFNKAAAHTDGTWRSAQIQSSMSPGVWYHVAATYDGANLRVYLNGTLEATTAHGTPIAAAGALALGNGVGFTNFAGQLDEVRVSTGARSDAWIQTEYNNHSSPSTFYSVGAENAASLVIGGDQSGRVYSVDVSTWTTIWTVNLSANADFIQATPAAQLRSFSDAAFQAAYTDDVVFVGSRNAGDTNCGAGSSATNNKIFALRASDGGLLWTFNADCSQQVDWIEGMPYVDYARNRLYVTSRAGGAGTQTSLWVIDTLTGAAVTPPAPLTLGHLRAAPSLSADGTTLYVGSWDGSSGTLYAVNLTTLAVKWSLPLGAAGNIKGFVWEDGTTPGRLYFSNGTDIRCVQDFGASGSACGGWTVSAVAGASTPLLLDKIYVGSSDGKIHQIDSSTGVDEKQFPAATTLDGTQVGDVSTETGNELFVGTLAGKLYKIPLPLP